MPGGSRVCSADDIDLCILYPGRSNWCCDGDVLFDNWIHVRVDLLCQWYSSMQCALFRAGYRHAICDWIDVSICAAIHLGYPVRRSCFNHYSLAWCNCSSWIIWIQQLCLQKLQGLEEKQFALLVVEVTFKMRFWQLALEKADDNMCGCVHGIRVG